jgi:hypothetical protein
MFDFQVILPREVIQVTSVRVVPGLSVRTLDVVGEDFRAVDEVLINGTESPDVVVLSKTRLLAQVPDALNRQTISSVSVISQRLVTTQKSFIDFKIAHMPGKVTGVLRLMQLFLKTLFTTPGSDIFSPQWGGGGLRPLGANFGKDQGGDIVSGFIVSVDNTTRQIVQTQSRQSRIRADERLLTARVTNAGYSKSETALLVTIEILSQAGRAATARLEL